MELRKYITKRIIQIIIIFFVILTVLFLLFRLAPGDPVSMMVDPDMTQEDAEMLIVQLGLEQPLGMQYLIYLKNFFTGHFGFSFHYGDPVVDIIWDRLPNTVLLFTTSIILSALVGVFLGKIASWHKGKKVDSIMTIGALVTHTVFLPWLALILIWIFAYKFGWFPINGMISEEVWLDPEAGFISRALDVMYHMVLPLSTLFLIHFGAYLLIMRSSMLETLKEDYILTARAKGLEEKVIRDHHAAPNAALPVVTSVGLSLAFSINGGALTETVFTWPGIGRELVSSVSQNDYPLAQACFLMIAGVVLISNLVVDVLYAYLDPRIRY
ncbi:MAG: ABC transporter permease [Deltaproteobacteria bacterium]|nr:ABC transporter permease [Deltaproteobacteria bacterium]MBW2047730.1 ABC transporter permease [Deltaproteobacteria bacterium]MBW2110373.1 ABC transporter permease [Deltaproteobacteria bacterium]MBW2352255.1 ABC transporter permease [Deltaproteobacteria bacterium]HDZ90070.1 ABC transporter permease [Deltaproteobacteria bacterium]